MITAIFSSVSVVESFNLFYLYKIIFAVENQCDLLNRSIKFIGWCHDHMTNLGLGEVENHSY